MERLCAAVEWVHGARRLAAALLVAGLALGGCAVTRTGRFGVLPNDEHLVTLVVSEDLGVVQRECMDVGVEGRLYGCQISGAAELPDGRPVTTVKIVRFADGLPSALAFEIDVHELCHAVAAVQRIDDPCHAGNDGVLTSAAAPSPVRWR